MTVAVNEHSNSSVIEQNSAQKDELDGDWHLTPIDDLLEAFETDPASGLTTTKIAVRQERYGRNELVERRMKSPWRILWEQITDVMVLILIGASVVSALVKDILDGAIIMAIVVLNTALGFVQEYRAEQAMAALKRMSAPVVRVRRDGRVVEIESHELVPGDVVLLESGSVMPADMRVIEAANLRVQEASLTGESEPVDKSTAPLQAARYVPIGDRTNMFLITEHRST